MHRFFVEPTALTGETVRLEGDVTHQVARVLRLRPGDEVELFDGSGSATTCRLTAISPRETFAVVTATSFPSTELREPLILAMALIQHSRFEMVVQKATELGVTTIQPVLCHFSQSSGADRVGADRLRRWWNVAREAAEQSGRTRVPDIPAPISFDELLGKLHGTTCCLLDATEHPDFTAPIHLVQAQTVIIGPEGGFSRSEIDLARAAGLVVVRLGCRIMRAETAAIAALTLAVSAREEWTVGRRRPG